MKQEDIRSEKGITLIALVVTIVVLLILAGITIKTLFGENGIIKTVQRTKEEIAVTEAEDIAKVAYADSIIKGERKSG